MLKCYAGNCPLKNDCYRYTQPYSKRDAFETPPYDWQTKQCDYFYSNIPKEDMVRKTAYFLWLAEGKPENKALEHWAMAFKQLSLGMGRDVSMN